MKIIPSFLGQTLPYSTAQPTLQEKLKWEEALSGIATPRTEHRAPSVVPSGMSFNIQVNEVSSQED